MLQVGMTIDRHVSHLSDAQLLTEVKRLAAAERHATAALLRALIELDERRLYLGEGCSSLFTYCTQVLHLSEGGAYNRIEAARAARRLPVLLELLEDGALTLTTIRLLAPHLTESNSGSLLDDARHKSKREVEELIARLRPKPDVAAVVRRLPTPALQLADQAPPTAESSSSPDSLPSVRPPVVKPLAPERYKLQLTISKETHDKLRHAQALVRHAVPDGDLAAIIDRTRANETLGHGASALTAKGIGEVPARARGSEAGRLGPRRRAVRVCGERRQMPGDGVSRVPSRDSPCSRRGGHGQKPRATLQGPQRFRSRNVLRQDRDVVRSGDVGLARALAARGGSQPLHADVHEATSAPRGGDASYARRTVPDVHHRPHARLCVRDACGRPSAC
jgi:hypothetical protein